MKSVILSAVEPKGLDTLIVGLHHPALASNPFMIELAAILDTEWNRRHVDEPGGPDHFDLPISSLTNEELKSAMGFFYGFAGHVDEKEFPGTYNFSLGLFHSLKEEWEFRTTVCQSMLN